MIDFSAAAERNAECLEGWSHQEPAGMWAVGDTSVVLWPGDDLRPGATLDLDVEPCLIAPYRCVQRLWVRLEHGSASARLDIDHRGVFRVCLPDEKRATTSRKLVFYHPDGIVPAEAGGLPDGRKLSLFFRMACRPAAALPPPTPLAPAQQAELMGRFESLGGTAQGCEFGLVQRAAGIERLGLLRWTSMTPESLAEALEQRFAGVGTPEQTVLDIFNWPDGGREYSTEDRRYLMRMHTWINAADKPAGEVMVTMCKRLVFLSRKLMETLAEARNILVFKTGDRICTFAEIQRIHRALRRYGPTTLLYVRLADAGHPPGSVRRVEDGLLIGYIDRFNETPDGTVLPPSQDIWLQICARAVEQK